MSTDNPIQTITAALFWATGRTGTDTIYRLEAPAGAVHGGEAVLIGLRGDGSPAEAVARYIAAWDRVEDVFDAEALAAGRLEYVEDSAREWAEETYRCRAEDIVATLCTDDERDAYLAGL